MLNGVMQLIPWYLTNIDINIKTLIKKKYCFGLA